MSPLGRSTGVLVAVGPAPFEAALLEVADRGGLHVVRRCVDVADLLATAAARQAAVAVVSAQLRGLDATVVSRLRREDVDVLGMTVEAASADEARLRELGVTVVVDAGHVQRLGELVEDVANDSADESDADHWQGESSTGDSEAGGQRSSGRVIAVWGPAGAPGRTTLACGLAAATADRGKRTLLVDADVYGGAVAAMFGLLDESSGLLAAARTANRGELRPEVLVRHARAVTPTLRVLTGLPRADRWVEVGSVLLRRILDTAASVAEVTVFDLGFSVEADEELSYDIAAPRRNGATLEALAWADLALVVGAADPISLGRLVRAVHDLRSALPSVTPHLVVNRCRGSLGWSDQEVTEMIGRATGLGVTAMLPDGRAACDRGLVSGKSLIECAPDSKLTKGISSLAASLVGVPEPVRRRRVGRAR
jgi:Flp pilus assembly CpaE family ATPase